MRAKARELGDKRDELADGAETAVVLKLLQEALRPTVVPGIRAAVANRDEHQAVTK